MEIQWIYGIFFLSFQFVTQSWGGLFHKKCIFHGVEYAEGEILPLSCFVLKCRNSKWGFVRIDGIDCDRCQLSDDPHFISFDNSVYDWHGTCSYSLSQPAVCDKMTSYDPYFMISADFETCNGAATCLETTTYKIDPFTTVTFEHKLSIPYTLTINGDIFSPLPTTPEAVSDYNDCFHPAVVWRDNSCAYIIGTTFSIKACVHIMYIYAHKNYKGKLVGLCGYYSGDPNDDFVPRGSSFNPVSHSDFASSWLTKSQIDVGCSVNQNEGCQSTILPSHSQRVSAVSGISSIIGRLAVTKCNTEEYRGLCEEKVLKGFNLCSQYQIYDEKEVEIAIQNCMKDCCAFPQRCGEWAEIAREMAAITCETDLSEEGIFLRESEDIES